MGRSVAPAAVRSILASTHEAYIARHLPNEPSAAKNPQPHGPGAHRELARDVLDEELGQRALEELDRDLAAGRDLSELPGVAGAAAACAPGGGGE